MIKKVLARFVFITLIVLIIYSAHFTSSSLFNRIYSMGLDVPITPFTADMTLMLTKEKKEPYYKKNYHLIYKTIKGKNRIEGEDLGWYEFKAPFQWMIGCMENSDQCPVAVYYLCRSLEDYTKTIVISWAVYDNNSEVANHDGGFGVEYRCPVR